MFMPKKVKSLLAAGATALSLFAFSPNALAFQEYPIGDEIEDTENHFKVALVYFQPVPMEPQGMMLSPDQADIHIETDIHATEGNECGFGVRICALSTNSLNAAAIRKVRLPALSCR